VVVDGRRGGAVAAAIDAIAIRCVDDLLSGRWEGSEGRIQEGLDLCDAHGHELARSTISACRALLAAAVGDDRTAREVAGRVVGWAQPRDLRGVEHLARYALCLAALGRGDLEEAYAQASAVSPAGEPVVPTAAALWLPLDLVEAAAGTGRHREAVAHAALLRDAGWARLSPRLAMLVPAAAAVTAPDDRAGDLFEEALAVGGADEWPFPLARVHLARGRHLRRRGQRQEAAASLAVALETFQRLGARPWEAQARTELRAAGVATGVDAHALPALTPEEHEIAALAASGLSNREIGERLFLSHRTVAARLRRIFPKLGVVSRAALRDALRLRTGA
jgi:DNA-binding CsgD family transcriptional regulator